MITLQLQHHLVLLHVLEAYRALFLRNVDLFFENVVYLFFSEAHSEIWLLLTELKTQIR